MSQSPPLQRAMHMAPRERKIGRPSKASPFAPKVAEWLARDPKLTTDELLWRAIDEGYTGHKTAFYALVAAVRARVAGDRLAASMERDKNRCEVRFEDGKTKSARFISTRLTPDVSFALTLVEGARTATIIVGGVGPDLEGVGGVHLLLVFEDASTNPVEPVDPKVARHVTRFVDRVQSKLIDRRVFRDHDDLYVRLEKWLGDLAAKPRARAEVPDRIELRLPVGHSSRVVTLSVRSSRDRA